MFDNISVLMFYLIFGIATLLLFFLFAFGIGHFRALRMYSRKNKPYWLAISLVALILCVFIGSRIGKVAVSAHKYGANYENYKAMTVSQFNKNIKLGLQVKIPKQKYNKPAVIIIDRFGCKDCNEVSKKIKKDFPISNKNVYYVPARSDYGKALVKKHQIKTVPTLVYVSKNKVVYVSNLMHNKKYNQETATIYRKMLKDKQ